MSKLEDILARGAEYLELTERIREANIRARELIEPFEPGLRKAFEGMDAGGEDEYRLGVEMLASYLVARHWGRTDGLFRALGMGRIELGGHVMQRALDRIFSNLVEGAADAIHSKASDDSWAARTAKFASGDYVLYLASEWDDETYERAWDDYLLNLHRHRDAVIDTLISTGSPLESPDLENFKALIGKESLATIFFRNRPPDKSIPHTIIASEIGQINNVGTSLSLLLSLWDPSDEKMVNEMLKSLLMISEPFSYIIQSYLLPDDMLAIVPMKDGRKLSLSGYPPMIRPASGLALRKIMRSIVTESAEAASEEAGPETPEISVDWRQASCRLVISDVGGRGLFRSFDAGKPAHTRLMGLAAQTGISLAFAHNSIAIGIPRRSFIR